jgi:very-short-patch-repair endonuclease
LARSLTSLAKKLRKNSTHAETVLWNRLRAKQIEGIKFRRQQPIEGIIVDFVSFEKRIVIELDGGQHATGRANDLDRDRFLEKSGYRVLRFWNNEVLENLEGVLNVITEASLR